MAPRGRSRRAARAAPAPELAEEADQGAPARVAPQAVESLSRLNRDYHIAGALALFLPYACSGEADAVHDRGRIRARHPAAGFRLRRIRFASRGVSAPSRCRMWYTILVSARMRILLEGVCEIFRSIISSSRGIW
ncbi:hypothetical protein PIB30_020862 [Stylosanthes scabra]|uniref:Uncharacterized protein n=1 Tax=Stylosanthes scabra TaxID=79078 RepID=A0ABU6V7R3_9FABA|nr:hypothetical protein [Stylosanthes scabra]